MKKLKDVIMGFSKRKSKYEDIELMGLAIIIGVVTGIVSIIFNGLLHGFYYIIYDDLYLPFNNLIKYKLIIFPILGALAVGIINKLFIPKEDDGFGVSKVLMELKYINRYLMKPKLVLIKTISTIITLGSGLSAGKQGPIVHLGGAIGSAIGYKLNFENKKIRVLIGCGVAGSLAGVFHTPISSTVFVLEILMNKDCLEYFTPVVISSITSIVLTNSITDDDVIFQIGNNDFGLLNYGELVYYGLLGMLIGLAAIYYIESIQFTKRFFKGLKLSSTYHPVLGAIVVVIIGYFLPNIFNIRYHTVGRIIEGNFSLKLLILLFIGKTIATGATLGSGNVGGVFLPGLFAGAAFGGIFGKILYYMVPEKIYNYSTYSLVGMGAMFASFANAPVTATLLILELTGNYSIMIPVLLCCTVGSMITKIIYKKTIYTVSIVDKH